MDHTKLGAEKMAGAEFCSEPIYEKRILFISSRSTYICGSGGLLTQVVVFPRISANLTRVNLYSYAI